MRSLLCFGAVSAVLGAAASSALASTVTLSNESSTGGLDLNSANVLFAASAVDSSTLSPSNLTVQGVTFTPMTFSNPNSMVTASENGITITATNITAYSHYSTYIFEYASASVNATTLTGGSSATLGFNASQPGDALQSLLSSGLQFVNVNPLIITISGLQSGNQYVIDLLSSTLGTYQRNQTVTFNGGTVLNPGSTPSASDGGATGYYMYSQNGYGNSFGYDTNDTVTAVGGEITIELVATYNGSASVGTFNDIVISSAVPEPASLGLIGMGVCGIGLRRRRRPQSPL